MSVVAPRAVVVTRATEYQHLLERHGTHEQARFFLQARGRDIAEVAARHERQEEALRAVSAAIPTRWRRARLDRRDLSRSMLGPEDVILAIGQDGLVANVAKYLTGQPVIGVNPDPSRYDGVLVKHAPGAVARLLEEARAGRAAVEERSMACATVDDGRSLRALNEIFVGHRAHQSARYRLRCGAREEGQSSSGVIVATGTGATGWARSIARQRRAPPPLPAPTEAALAFFVREPFPSRSTGTKIEHGRLSADEALEIVSELEDGGTVFADGIEDDWLELGWGARVRLTLATHRLRLIVDSSPLDPRSAS